MSAKCKYQKSKPKSKFKNIFNFWFWSLSLVLLRQLADYSLHFNLVFSRVTNFLHFTFIYHFSPGHIIFATFSAIRRGFSACQMFRPTATPQAPAAKTSSTIFKKSPSAVFGPP